MSCGDLFASAGGQPAADAAPRGADDGRLKALYEHEGRGLDDLPYSPEFLRIVGALAQAGDKRDARELFHRLQNLRKAGKLPKLGRSATVSAPVRVRPEEEEYLRGLVEASVGSLGSRDQIPYSEKMETIVNDFNGHTGRNLSPHDVWRLIAKLAK